MKHYSRDAWRAISELEFKEEGDDTDPVKAIERLNAALDQKMATFSTELKSATDRFDAEIAKLKRPGTESKAADEELERKAFEKFIRKGPQALTADEFKTLQLSTDTDGGILAPEAFIPELLRNVALFSPVRGLARVAALSSSAAILPRRTGGMTATWVGETQTRSETSVTFGQNRYPVNEIAAYVDVSNQLIEDSAFNIEAELAFEFGEEFGVKESAAFVNGDGVNKPHGFMQDSSIAYSASGHASQITADAFIDLYHAVPAAYRGDAVWGMNSNTLSAVRKLKDGNGNYLVTVSGLAGAPATTIMGSRVVEMPDMPDIASGAFPVVWGSFASGYRIFDRIALSILRDPFTQATTGKTRFHGRRRVAGGVAKAEALRKLKIGTS